MGHERSLTTVFGDVEVVRTAYRQRGHANLHPVDDARSVIGQAFDQAERRDPTHIRPWVALVDGANHQIEVIETEATERHIRVTIVIDLIHVLEYLWKAVWSFFDEGDPAAETWVHDKAVKVLDGKARQVAAAARRRATREKLTATRRKGADTCANYLTSKSRYLDYPAALANGWPIATGVIEGACRPTGKGGWYRRRRQRFSQLALHPTRTARHHHWITQESSESLHLRLDAARTEIGELRTQNAALRDRLARSLGDQRARRQPRRPGRVHNPDPLVRTPPSRRTRDTGTSGDAQEVVLLLPFGYDSSQAAPDGDGRSGTH